MVRTLLIVLAFSIALLSPNALEAARQAESLSSAQLSGKNASKRVPTKPRKQEQKENKGKQPKAEARKAHAQTKKAREQQVAEFVERHQPELAKLLVHLKRHKPEEHKKAVRDLFRTVTRLEEAKAKDLPLYKLELRAWQAKTRVQLLVAQYLVAGSAELKTQLRQALREELEARVDRIAYKRDAAAADYNQQIERLHKNREQIVAGRLRKLLNLSRKGDKKNPQSGKRPE